MRAGTHALTLLSVPLNVHVITALAEEPRALIDLRRAVGSPPQTTMRGHLRTLTELGILNRRRATDFPGSVDYELTRSGQQLLALTGTVQDWLDLGPEGSLSLGSMAAKSAIKSFIEGWSSALVRALAARPLTLTELNRLITNLNYPSLERRLVAMRLAGLIEPCPGERRGTPYAATPWLRRAVAPLAAAALWEREHLQASTPLSRIDFEATFLLAVPLVELSSEYSGNCRLAVEIAKGDGSDLAGVLVGIRNGAIQSCVSRLQGDTQAWASGSGSAWLRSVVLDDDGDLQLGGDWALAKALLGQLHSALYDISSVRP